MAISQPKFDAKAQVDDESLAQLQEGTGRTILVVEDDPDVRRVTIERLKILGYKILEADSGSSALAIVESGAPIDLVFSDVNMPGGMSGFELAQRVRERRPEQKLLLTSGFTGESAQAGEAAISGALILRKPYSQQELGGCVRVALEA